MAPAVERFFAAPIPAGRGGVIASPFQFLRTGEDNLRVSVYNVVAGLRVGISGRMLRPDSSTVQAFRNVLTPTADGELSTEDYALGPGAVLNLVVAPIGTIVEAGRCYVRVDIIRGLEGGTTVLGTLVAGYIGSWGGRGWPGHALEQPGDGPGAVRVYTSAVPALGADPLLLMPVLARWRVLAARAVLTTDATAGDRRPYLTVVQDVAFVHQSQTGRVQPASATVAHVWGAGLANTADAVSSLAMGSLPTALWLTTRAANNADLRMSTGGLRVGDQWSALTVLVEEWRNPVTILS
jgi:hypothetical protein